MNNESATGSRKGSVADCPRYKKTDGRAFKKSLTMLTKTTDGWLYSLKDENSHWGVISDFYESFESAPIDENGNRIIMSPVWGKLRSGETLPAVGDGFAFYHSTRAGFPEHDRFGRKPRISAVGQLAGIKLDGLRVSWIQVVVSAASLEALKESPIVRDDSTRSLFEQCKIVSGPASTLYRAPMPVWQAFLELLPAPARAV